MDSIEDLSSMAVATSTDLLPFTALTTADTLTPPMLIRIIKRRRGLQRLSLDSQAPPDRLSHDYRNDDDRELLEQDYRSQPEPTKRESSEAAAEPVSAQPSTLFIFKDGHQQEISNYAIVGSTLYDLSEGPVEKGAACRS